MKRNSKRTLMAWVLTLAMVVSLLPTAALAASGEAAEEEAAAAEQAEESTATEQTEDSVIEEEIAAESVSGQGYQLAEDSDSETATSGTCGDDLTWTLEDGILTISGTGEMTSSPWEDYVDQIQTLVIENGVTSISSYAFEDCTGLTSVTIPDSVTSIGYQVFNSCTSLMSVTIGSGVTSIFDFVFYDCTDLTEIQVSADNTAYCSVDGVLFNKSMTSLICYPAGKTDTSYSIPDSVTSFAIYAFYHCTYLTSVTIPDSVTGIGNHVFCYCTGLASVTFPNSMIAIGYGAFEQCRGLQSVTIPDSVTSIGRSAFSGCKGLQSVTIPNSVTSIGDGAFWSCTGLTSVTIGSSVTSIGDGAFSNCTGLTSVTIPDSVTSIGTAAFYLCTRLTSVTIGSGVTSIGASAFRDCTGLTDVYYSGSEDDWAEISIESYNSCLTNATIHYSNTGSDEEEEFSVSFSFNSESYVVLGEDPAYISGSISVTGDDADVDTELSAMTVKCSDTSIADVEFNPDGFISSVGGKSASAFYAFIIHPYKPGMITITLTASNGKTFEKDLYVEPELVVTAGSSYVRCAVSLKEADAAYLEDFITQLTMELDMDKTGPILSDEEYEIAEDGLSATYTWRYSVSEDDSGTATVTSPVGQSVSKKVSFVYETMAFTSRDIVSNMQVGYSDNYFNQSSYTYNHDLAWLSLCLELSSFTATSDTESWGETDQETAQARYTNIEDAYNQMGFESASYYNYDKSLNDTSDQVAYSIASKTLSSGETLVAVVIRGGGYGAEWSSNFNVGDGSDYHEGFNSAATEVYESVLDYLSGINGDVKLWVTGYSRGAAPANLLAAKIDDNAASSDQYDAEDVFAYTFATPQGVTTNQNTSASLYKNIFNIVNPGDVVPAVALSGWGFTRYGVTKYFNINASDSVFSEVESTFNTYSGETFDAENNINQYVAVSALTDVILKQYSSAGSASSLLNVVQEVLEYFNTKAENNGEWENISANDYYDTLSLKYGNTNFTTALDKACEYVTDTSNLIGKIQSKLGTDTTEMITLILLCCELNGISCDEAYNLIMNIFETTATTSALFYLLNYLPDGVGGVKVAHYPSVYLAWMSLDEEEAFTESSKWTTVLSLACPIDVTVYGSDGTEIAVVVDHELVESEVPVIIDEDVITIYLPAYEEYSVVITATDDGIMNYTITELDIDQIVQNRINYYDVELVSGRVLTGTVDTNTDYSTGKYDLTYEEDNIETVVSADEVLTENFNVTLTAETVGGGTITGAGSYYKGDTAVLKAFANDNYNFEGWYIEDELISSEEVTTLCLLADTAVTGVFTEIIHTYDAPTFTWSDDYTACTATFTCTDGDDTQTVDCTVTSDATAATTTAAGRTVYTATVTFSGETYIDTRTVTIPATGDTGTGDTDTGDTDTGSTDTGSTDTGDTDTGSTDTGDTDTGDTGTGSTNTGDTNTGDTDTGSTDTGNTDTGDTDTGDTNTGDMDTGSADTGDSTHTHTWDEGTVTLAATRVSEGEKTYTCTVCGETKTETIAKLTGSAAAFLFSDVTNEESWYYNAVYWAYDLSITAGYDDGTFRPNNNCTRAEFTTFLYALANAYGLENAGETTSTSFTDVKSGSWYYTYVMWAAENGLVSGYSDGTFKPNNQITRAEAVTMLYGFFKTFVNGGQEPTVTDEASSFSDLSDTAWYYTYMSWATQNGVVSGYTDSTCRPNISCTRSVMVVLLFATADNLLTQD